MRINVIETTGSGKRFFSKRLTQKLNIPCIEIEAQEFLENFGV